MSQGHIQGSMREAPLPDIIQLVGQGGKSGCFHVIDEPKRAKIFLKDGRLIHAVSRNAEGLDAVYEVALWLDGRYSFEEGDFGVEASITRSTPAVLMEMHRRMDEWRVISQKITSLDLYPASTLLPGESVRGVNPKQAKLLKVLTGWYTISELAQALKKPVLTVAKDLYDLVMTGYVVMKGIRSGKSPDIPSELLPKAAHGAHVPAGASVTATQSPFAATAPTQAPNSLGGSSITSPFKDSTQPSTMADQPTVVAKERLPEPTAPMPVPVAAPKPAPTPIPAPAPIPAQARGMRTAAEVIEQAINPEYVSKGEPASPLATQAHPGFGLPANQPAPVPPTPNPPAPPRPAVQAPPVPPSQPAGGGRMAGTQPMSAHSQGAGNTGAGNTGAGNTGAGNTGAGNTGAGTPGSGKMLDPAKIQKLLAFSQRIAVTAERALPQSLQPMVEACLVQTMRQINDGAGPEAVKNMALNLSKKAVEAGCDADTVKILNTQLKALFSRSG